MIAALSERERKKKLAEKVQQIELSREVLDLILPDGHALEEETELWDYKLSAPDWRALKGTEEERTNFKQEEAELIKDCMAFYNSYGGYIIFGVDDRSRSVVGAQVAVDTDELKRQFQSFTGVYVPPSYRTFTLSLIGGNFGVGLLCIPQRAYTSRPIEARKNPPHLVSEGVAFSRKATYIFEGRHNLAHSVVGRTWSFW